MNLQTALPRRFEVITLLLLFVALCGCSEKAPEDAPAESDDVSTSGDAAVHSAEASPGTLAGTSWRLVEIQSMDDAVGTVRPENPELFTMELNADGTVNMALDCNRANGTWSAEPSDDGTSGTFEFGPMAGTRAMCAPPNLDETITRQSEYVRSYLLRDGRLSLSLMADGGIQIWEPAIEP